MGQFLDSIKTVKDNYGIYDEWEQNQADERAKKEYLSKVLDIPKDKVELTSKKAQTVIRATEILDKYSEDNCEDVEMATGLVTGGILALVTIGFEFAMMPALLKAAEKSKGDWKLYLKNSSKTTLYGAIASTLATIGVFSGLTLWSNNKQKEASRIGRFQAMQNDLKDVKNFVIYTPEQLEQAEEKAKTIPDKEEREGLLDSIRNLKKISDDRRAYDAYSYQKEQDGDEVEKLKSRKLTKEQIESGKADRELIVDTVKEINIKAEEYSENLENSFDTVQDVSFLATVPAIWLLSKALGGKNKAISFGVPIAFNIALAMYGTNAQKEASRVGRYQARKDLSENPARLMAYSDEEMKQAENITAPKQKKSVFEKVSQSFSFLIQYYKDQKEYNEYKKEAYQHQEKLQKAFADIEITEKQRKDAENLQKKTFLAFEEIDEMSQRYSEDVEAGCEIAKNASNNLFGLIWPGLMALFGYKAYKGEINWTKYINKVTNLGFRENSSFRKAVNEFYETLKKENLLQKFHESPLKFWKTEEAKPALAAKDKLLKESSIFSSLDFRNGVKGFRSSFETSIEPQLKEGRIAKWVRNLFFDSGLFYSREKAAESAHNLRQRAKDLEKILKNEGVENCGKKIAEDLSQTTEAIKQTTGMDFSGMLSLSSYDEKVCRQYIESLEKRAEQTAGFSKHKFEDYDTLIKTVAIGGIPIIGGMIAIPYMINAALTDIQKKAGKIGIMKAMDKIDDPRVFADAKVNTNQVKKDKTKAPQQKRNNIFANF